LDEKVKTAVIFNSFLTVGQLLESILLEFGLPSKGRTKKERIDHLNRYLIQSLSRGENAVLIIDEAQNLSIPVLEQVRMLSNLETEKEKMLQIVLLGQLELDKKLRSPELRQLNQRIALRLRLYPFTRAEMEDYIRQRLSVAGASGNITLSKSAFDEIYRFTGGTPRLINLLCERVLLAGFVESSCSLSKKIVKKAKKSLLTERTKPLPSLLGGLQKHFAFLRVASLMFLFLFIAILILSSQGPVSSLQVTKDFIRERIQTLHARISGTTLPAFSKIPPKKISDPDAQEIDDTKNSKRTQEEKTK
jgi:type II secretory pathway predicted ATPase ExeA